MSTAASGGELVTREARDRVGIVTLNRPEVHNAISTELRYALRDAFAWAEGSPEVGAVLLRGNGRSFCSGRDLAELGFRPEGQTHAEGIGIAQSVRLKQWEMKKPVVAVPHGHVIGAGVELALAMDFRVAADDTRFRLPEIDYGLAVDTGSSVFATALAGPSRAKWLIMSGATIDATQALAWGLVDWVVPRAELDARSFEVARTLAAKPPEALKACKALVNELFDAQVRSGLRRELQTQALLFETPDVKRLRDERTAARAKRAASKN